MSESKISTGKLLFSCAGEMGMQPRWLTRRLLCITTPSAQQYIFYTKSILNSHISVLLSSNKFLARTLLGSHNLPNIPYAKPRNLSEAKMFLNEHGTVIAKPLRGIGARDINLIKSVSDMAGLKFGNYIFEKYILGREMRFLILNNRVIAVHESNYGVSLDEHRPLQRISYEQSKWNHELVELTKTIAKVFNLRFAAIDFIVQADGRIYILEVNCTPGLKWFHQPSRGPAVNVARLFLQAILDDGIPVALPLVKTPTLEYSKAKI